MENKSRIAIILLNWNGVSDTLECVKSIMYSSYKNYQIIIADNKSSGDDVKILKKELSDSVIFIENEANLGFAEGNNRALKYAVDNNFDYCLLLNNDTTIKNDLLENLIISAKLGYSIIGGRIYNYYDRTKIWFGGGELKKYFGVPRDIKNTDREQEVDFVSGCMMMISSELIKKIGYLNKEYFAYWEDIEFCLRAKKNGYAIYYNPEAICYHKISASGKQGKVQTYYEVRNRFLVLKEYFSTRHRIIAYLFYFFISLPKHLIKNIYKGRFGNIAAEIRALHN